MVDSGVVLGTVKNMIDSGLGDDIIKETLKDIGLSDSEIKSILMQARGENPAMEEKAQKAQAPVQALKPAARQAVEGQGFPASEVDSLDNASIHNAIQDLGEKVDSLHSKVDNVQSNTASQILENPFDSKPLQSRIDTISTDVKELKAGTNALVDLMKKILETDREVLLRLEGKKK